MKIRAAVLVAVLGAVATPAMFAAETASPTDKAFVAAVSQGGAYEVEAGKVAMERGVALNIRDLGAMEAHDHDGVNGLLKEIAGKTGAPIAGSLNAEFQAKLDKLKSVPAGQFDQAFITAMIEIHEGDQKKFAAEAVGGTAPYKGFAHQADLVVRRHLGALKAPGTLN